LPIIRDLLRLTTHLQDPDDCDDFAPDGSLGSLLEEFRKSKQEKRFKLEERAARDGRPFSAPVASPSCDDIKKRQLDSRALKETPPGVPQPTTASKAGTKN
jgi:hypothetical protein